MKIIRTAEDIRTYRASLRNRNLQTGFIPTMGALHRGHISLVKTALEITDVAIVSIFINPPQFNDPDDLKKYPRTLDKDLKILEENKVDAVFVPGVREIYPQPDKRQFHFGDLENVMEGRHRPGHFNGVAQVVSILFDMIDPDKAFFGQKDFQQLAIIRKLVKMLNLRTEIIACPVIREKNGLAMSSRNQLLSGEDREVARLIYETLKEVIQKKDELSPPDLAEWGKQRINAHPKLEVEYFEIVNTSDLQSVSEWEKGRTDIACTAVKINNVRLIDNMIFP